MKKLILTVAILMFCKSLFADSDIHTISLKHRLASEVVDQVRPFLPESATIKAYDNMLILKSDRATVANVEQLIKKLDVPLKSVLVTVWQTSEQLNHQSGHQANIELSTEEPNASVSIKQWSTKGKDDKNNRYSAQGIAGQPIAINIGNARPEKDYLYFVNANGNIGFASNTQYISTSRGFMAVPFLLSDNNVKVEIHPFFSDRSHDGQINSSNLISTVHGKLGQWIEIAYVSEDQHKQKEGLKQYQTHQGQQQIIYLKVETSSN
ncbi:MAG: secretin N-terminal domain-containing protein [Pseudomonadota bacterium]|nr:secretin N-terminal domain-containing protein [Pseudomonadota bacterium]